MSDILGEGGWLVHYDGPTVDAVATHDKKLLKIKSEFLADGPALLLIGDDLFVAHPLEHQGFLDDAHTRENAIFLPH